MLTLGHVLLGLMHLCQLSKFLQHTVHAYHTFNKNHDVIHFPEQLQISCQGPAENQCSAYACAI